MAMIQCPECQQTVSELAPNCPNCGAPIASRHAQAAGAPPPPPPPAKKRSGCVKMGCAVAAVFIVLAFVYSLVRDRSDGGSTSTTATSGTSRSDSAAPETAAPGSQWSYSHEEDAMAKGTVSRAAVQSTNTVNFRFPYAGPQHGTLTLRTHPRWGKSVIFNIEKGQLLCRAYDGCQVVVRFDDAQPVNYAAAAPEDNSTETIFITDYNGFVAKMMKAKKVRISPNVYQEGAPVFEFDVSNFDQARYKR